MYAVALTSHVIAKILWDVGAGGSCRVTYEGKSENKVSYFIATK
jgi:hypothetical protein